MAPGIEATCKSFVESSRARYLRGIPSALQKGRIQPLDGRSLDIEVAASGHPQVRYLDAQGIEKVEEADFVIDAIGFARDLLNAAAPKDVFANLPVTGRAVVARETYPGAFLAGVASDAPVTKEELANVDNNRVSLYLNLVRVEALMGLVAEQFGESFGGYPDVPQVSREGLGEQSESKFTEIVLLNPNGFVQGRDFSREYIDVSLESALRELALPAKGRGRIRLLADLKMGNPHFMIGDIDLEGARIGEAAVNRLISALTVHPTFFSILAESIDREGAMEIVWSFEIKDSRMAITAKYEKLKQMPNLPVSSSRVLRGFRKPEPLRFQCPVERPAVRTPAPVSVGIPDKIPGRCKI